MPRKLKSQDGNPYDIIRGMWEGAYASHFLRLFQKKFDFDCLTTQDLEEALIDDESFALGDIFARLLRYVTGNTDILIVNFDEFLKKILIQEEEVSRLLESNTTWQDLTPEEKLAALKWLIDHVHQKKEEDIADFLDENYCADELRGVCVGQDAFNNVYWYLDDLRLYREFPHKKHSRKDWECVCSTLSDWHSFIKQYRKTSNLQEKELYSYLNFELLPFIELELINKRNKLQTNKQEKNDFLVDKESKELKDMLEKKVNLDSNNGLKSNILCSETQNVTVAPIDSSESCSSEITVKTNDDSIIANMNFCDNNQSVANNICSASNNISPSVMDVKTSSSVNICTNSCTSTSTSSNEANGNNSCGQESNCTTLVTTANSITAPREVMQEGNHQQSLNDIPSDSSSVTSNKENAPPSSGSTGNDIPPMSAITSMVGSTPTPATTASIQPLPSNMVNKTSYQMDTQYMQQQSQIFVFSTALANKAAESYLSGNFPSIIAFHCAQPGTKSFLEKYPLKVQQFNRQNPAAWLNSLAQGKQPGGRQMKTAFPLSHTINNNRFPGPSGGAGNLSCSGACNMHNAGMCTNLRNSSPWPNNCNSPGIGPSVGSEICSQSWSSSQMGVGMSSPSINQRYPGPPHGVNVRHIGPPGNPMMACMGNINANSTMPSFPNAGMNSLHMNQGPGCQSSLAGVKVPDENLTPQQRQHREEQLAMIRKMQQLLFPEQQHIDQGGMGSNMLSMMAGMQNQHSSQPRFPFGETCIHSGMDGCFSPHQTCVSEGDRSHMPLDMYSEQQMVGPNFFQQNYPSVSVSAQLEWQKLQRQFYEERRKKDGCSNTSLTDSFSGMQPQNAIQQPPQQSQSQQSTPQPLTPQQPQNLNSPNSAMGLSPGVRMQGPPPPYHQTNKRTMPSPHPASPNTSSISLPSPLGASGLPSPADTSSRQFPVPTPPGPKLSHHSPGSVTPAGGNSLHTTPLNSPKPSGSGSNITHIRTPTTPSNTNSTPCGTPTSSCQPIISNSNPATPVSSCASSFKQNQTCTADVQDSNSLDVAANTSSEFASPVAVSTSSNVQGELFCHDKQSCNQAAQKQETPNNHSGAFQKEPSLMPVPSPQQIQYLNTFDGQELTIQKQPNTGIRELDAMSPQSKLPSMAMSGGSQSQFQSPDANSFPNTPGSCPSTLENSQDSFTGRCSSSVPASVENSLSRFTARSPQISGLEPGSRQVQTPQMNDSCTQRFPVSQNTDGMKNSNSNSVPRSPLAENNNRFLASGSQNPTVCSSLNISNNVPHFSYNSPDAIPRFRGSGPHSTVDMGQTHSSGINSHIRYPETFTSPSQYSSMGSEGVTPSQGQTFSGTVPPMTSQSDPCIGGSFIDNSMSHSHLQNLQKMTPPFENLTGNKVASDVMSPMSQCSNTSVNNSNLPIHKYGGISPLSPSHVNPSQRLAHFDPIASMAAMSESTVPMAPGSGSAQTHPNASNMNMTNMQISNNTGNSPSNINFHNNVQSMQHAPNSSSCSIPNQNQFSVHNPVGHGDSCINHSVNNTYANSNMPIQQINGQNVVVSTSYTTCGQGPNVNPHAMHPNCLGNGATTLSSSVTTNHPIMHTAVTPRMSNANVMVSGPRHATTNFSGPRIAPPPSAGSPSLIPRAPQHFNRTNIQVKANAPNTIQYLPARQQCNAPSPNRPPTLEFLQRFAAPLTNLDSKVPTHNLQYFPNSGGSHPHSIQNNMGVNPGSGPLAPNLLSNHRPVNMMMEPMMRRANTNMTHPSGSIYPVGSGVSSAESSMFGRPSCPSMNNQIIPMNSMSGNQGAGMFQSKQMPLSMGGMAPEATQPLPPSMGQSFNYKQSPFYGPTTADPNYAVQFHNFQQQLYATNTRGSQMNPQTNMNSQGFFGPK